MMEIFNGTLFNGTPTLLILVYLLYGIRVAYLCEERNGNIPVFWWISIAILWIPLVILGTIRQFGKKS